MLQYQTSNENAPPTKFLQSHRLLPRYIYPVFGRHGIPLLFPSPKRRICHGQTSVQPSQLSSKTTQLAFRTSSRTPSTLHRPPRTGLPSRPPTGLPGTRLPCTAHQDPSTLDRPPRPVYPAPPAQNRPPKPSTLHRPPRPVYPAPPTQSRLPCTAHQSPSTRLPWTADHRPPARLPWTAHHRPPPPTTAHQAVYPGPTTHRPPRTRLPWTALRSEHPSPSRPVYPGPPSARPSPPLPSRLPWTASPAGTQRRHGIRPPSIPSSSTPHLSRSRSISPLPVRLAGSAPAGSRWEI